MRSQRPVVLLLSSDPIFSRDVTASWPHESELPEFVVLDGDLCGELQADTFDLAIADVSSNEKRIRLKQAIAATGKPAILAAHEASAPSSSGSIVELSRETEAWAAIVGLLGREILRRRQA